MRNGVNKAILEKTNKVRGLKLEGNFKKRTKYNKNLKLRQIGIIFIPNGMHIKITLFMAYTKKYLAKIIDTPPNTTIQTE